MKEFLYYDKSFTSKTKDNAHESSLEKLKREISDEWAEHTIEKLERSNK